MIDTNNSFCAICGKPYELCASCSEVKSLNPWKLHTDTPEHYKVYQILHGYSTDVYTEEEAREKFKRVDLSDMDTFRPDIKKAIEKIMKSETKKAKEYKKDVQKNIKNITVVKNK